MFYLNKGIATINSTCQVAQSLRTSLTQRLVLWCQVTDSIKASRTNPQSSGLTQKVTEVTSLFMWKVRASSTIFHLFIFILVHRVNVEKPEILKKLS